MAIETDGKLAEHENFLSTIHPALPMAALFQKSRPDTLLFISRAWGRSHLLGEIYALDLALEKFGAASRSHRHVLFLPQGSSQARAKLCLYSSYHYDQFPFDSSGH